MFPAEYTSTMWSAFMASTAGSYCLAVGLSKSRAGTSRINSSSRTRFSNDFTSFTYAVALMGCDYAVKLAVV